MGNDLDGLAEIVAAPLGGDHRRVDRPGGGVGSLREVLVDEAFVVTQIQIGLAAVVGDEHLTVLEGVHGAGVDVEVRVEFLQGHAQATRLQQAAECRCRDPLTERTRDTAGDEYMFGHGNSPYLDGCRVALDPSGYSSSRSRAPTTAHSTPVNSSTAWSRADALAGEPDNMRDTSTTLASVSSRRAWERVRPSSAVLSMTI